MKNRNMDTFWENFERVGREELEVAKLRAKSIGQPSGYIKREPDSTPSKFKTNWISPCGTFRTDSEGNSTKEITPEQHNY